MKHKFSFSLLKRLPDYEKRLTISNQLTLFRIFLTPFIVFCMINWYWGFSCFLFMIAAITDLLDGNIARWRNEKTFLGACLDPIADKILVVSIFFTLAFVKTPLFTLPHWFVLCVVTKEMVLIGGALYIYKTKGHIEIQPTVLGKITTLVQMCFIMWLFACYFFTWLPIKTYYTLLIIVILLAGLTLIQYSKIGVYQTKNELK